MYKFYLLFQFYYSKSFRERIIKFMGLCGCLPKSVKKVRDVAAVLEEGYKEAKVEVNLESKAKEMLEHGERVQLDQLIEVLRSGRSDPVVPSPCAPVQPFPVIPDPVPIAANLKQ